MDSVAEDLETKVKSKADGFNKKFKEGKVAKSIEKVTAKLPSDAYLWVAVAAMGTSLTLQLLRMRHVSLFVGQWAAPILVMGVYNKLVKQEGHDSQDKPAENASTGLNDTGPTTESHNTYGA